MTPDNAPSFEFESIKPIRGYPELRWTGKRPYISTVYYPAQLKESYGEEREGWLPLPIAADGL